ncbi:MAG: ABC transporter permease [Lentisphaeria bacterium]|nr:ABC transporter permease [Lentisphaeria bacterium]
MNIYRHEKIRKFTSDRLATAGLVMVIFLFFIAFFAPFIANGRPLFVLTDGKIELPFLQTFFAPDSSEFLIEQFFNYALLLLAAFGLTKLIPAKFKKTKKFFPAIFAILLLIPFGMAEKKLDKTNFRELYANKKNIITVFAPIPYGPYEQCGSPYEIPSKKHILGTDDIGRSVASRLIYGARISLAVGIFATALSLLIGCIVGMLTGYFKGTADLVSMRLIEILNCFPTFLLLLILMAMLKDRKFEQSVLIIIAVLGLTSWIGLALLVRGETLKQSSLAYILSCKASGLPLYRTLFFHLLPNISGVIFISFTFGIAGAILAESSLSFLGFGVQAPTASWGGLLRQSFEDPLHYWHLTFFPGLALFIAVCGFNFMGEGLRKALSERE